MSKLVIWGSSWGRGGSDFIGRKSSPRAAPAEEDDAHHRGPDKKAAQHVPGGTTCLALLV